MRNIFCERTALDSEADVEALVVERAAIQIELSG